MVINNKFEPKIIWEKWIDPLGFDNDEINEEDQYSDSYDDQINNKYKPEQKIKMIITPFGAISYNEQTASGKIFNFWNGHTNFSITKKISDAIESTDGIETLDVFTKYRFRISVGKAFNDSEVMRDVNNNVYQILEY
jgi:hypothetical protein